MFANPLTSPRAVRLGLLAAALLGSQGCGGREQEFDINQLAEVTDDSDGSFTWTRPSSESLNCIKAPCPSYILNEVNTGDTHFVYMLDWRALRLSPELQNAAEHNAPQLLLYGRYTDVTVLGESAKVYQILSANLRLSQSVEDRPKEDRYYRVQTADYECQQPPCSSEWKATLLLQGSQPEKWKDINLDALALPAEMKQPLLDELKTGQDYLSVSSVGDQVAHATQVFRPIKAPPLN
jgi:hypothetical protein